MRERERERESFAPSMMPMWRAAKNSLPSKVNLVRRKIIQDDCCDLCKEHKEDVKHALYSYPKLECF